ncbi:MAG: FAD-dependent oxidoreductase [Bacteroidales bacterium]|nr:FAD-dependent oxidoreductase [Bacteroidales bacterium]
MRKAPLIALALALCSCTPSYDIVVIGGGTGGTSAAIEAARDGAKVLVVESTPWLGGMLTSAGVSAIDGNYRLRGGIFGEFTDSLAIRYGGYDALKSGWVSNILFNPKIGEEILRNMTLEAGVHLKMETSLDKAVKDKKGWGLFLSNGKKVHCSILVDGTELGDVAESLDVAELKDRITAQDLTYVAILKDYGHPVGMEKPEGYDISFYRSCCDNPLAENIGGMNPMGQQLWSPGMMLSYGRLPDGYIMLNWPICGNDYFAEYLDMDKEERKEVVKKAKLRTLGFIYFLKTELGYANIGIADDVFPTEDGLPFYPYYREARRIAGRDTMTVDAAVSPYDYDLYKRAVAVGDYPVDHHHVQNPMREELSDLWHGSIPSFSVPLGVVIPVDTEDFLVADKAMSSSWEMNGGTRLQPVVMGIGQACGALAALAVRSSRHPSEVPAEEVQKILLDHGCYLLPFLDLSPSDPGFRELQEKGVRGEVKGKGRSVGWANETWVNTPDDE